MFYTKTYIFTSKDCLPLVGLYPTPLLSRNEYSQVLWYWHISYMARGRYFNHEISLGILLWGAAVLGYRGR